MVWAPLAGGGILTGAKFATFTCWKRMRTICPVAESSKPHYIRALSHRCLRLATTSCLSECGIGPFHPLEVALDASRRAGECGKSQYRSAGGIRTEQCVSFLMSRIGTNQIADNAFAAILIHSTLSRVHLQQSAGLMMFGLFGVRKGCK